MSGQGVDEMGQPVPYPLTGDTPRLYVSVFFLLLFSPGDFGGRAIADAVCFSAIFRTHLIQRHSRIRRHPRRSTRRARATSTIAPPATYSPTDKHTAACQKFEEERNVPCRRHAFFNCPFLTTF
jgi:hypothetical protein